MSFVIVIPARYASSRLPGKPLLDIAGKPMIQRVYERAMQTSARQVVVATDDQRIVDTVANFGGQALMTAQSHTSGTDRLEEVAGKLGLADEQIVVNLQGDEPLMPVAAVEQVAKNLAENPSCGIATLCECINDTDEIDNPNAVKVVRDNDRRALYFSRATIPHSRDGDYAPNRELWYRHLGIYAYRVRVLRQFVQWPPAPLEMAEMLEQLRALYNGVAIHCDEACEAVPAGVDTADDLERARQVLSRQA